MGFVHSRPLLRLDRMTGWLYRVMNMVLAYGGAMILLLRLLRTVRALVGIDNT